MLAAYDLVRLRPLVFSVGYLGLFLVHLQVLARLIDGLAIRDIGIVEVHVAV